MGTALAFFLFYEGSNLFFAYMFTIGRKQFQMRRYRLFEFLGPLLFRLRGLVPFAAFPPLTWYIVFLGITSVCAELGTLAAGCARVKGSCSRNFPSP